MKDINLNLSIEQTNVILQALGNLPFVQVHELIDSIQEQASKQVAEQEQSEAAPADNLVSMVAE
ncbi:MAG: hypothetical protein COA42_04945 [Alteromonadaceae bacterium]|nr:MAG: hypothetical protein COA42_04945 [Alteromonadaceae bacterium]